MVGMVGQLAAVSTTDPSQQLIFPGGTSTGHFRVAMLQYPVPVVPMPEDVPECVYVYGHQSPLYCSQSFLFCGQEKTIGEGVGVFVFAFVLPLIVGGG